MIAKAVPTSRLGNSATLFNQGPRLADKVVRPHIVQSDIIQVEPTEEI